MSSSFDDPFAGVESSSPKPSPGKGPSKKDKFDQPISISRREVYKATGTGSSAMHGKHYQLTTRLPLDLLDQLREWATTLDMTQQDLQRYCFYRGLQALAEGERPEFEEVIVTKKLKQPQ
ncbi:MAG: hypothetical protein AB1791_00190 [Chloroflexota bacterium]